MSILFTQYLLPDGKKVPIYIDMDIETEIKATILLENGFHFDAEVLSTGLVSFTCEDDEEPISIEICENGPMVENAIRNLIDNALENAKDKNLIK